MRHQKIHNNRQFKIIVWPPDAGMEINKCSVALEIIQLSWDMWLFITITCTLYITRVFNQCTRCNIWLNTIPTCHPSCSCVLKYLWFTSSIWIPRVGTPYNKSRTNLRRMIKLRWIIDIRTICHSIGDDLCQYCDSTHNLHHHQRRADIVNLYQSVVRLQCKSCAISQNAVIQVGCSSILRYLPDW